MIFLFIPLLIVCVFWLIGFFFQNDFSIPTASIKKYKKVLVVFPHPDDETLTAGGTIRQLSKNGARVVVHVLTKGERGTDDAHFDEGLKTVRTKELTSVVSILGAANVISDDLGDGELERKRNQVKRRVDEIIISEKPDLIITYDLSGKYGHPDHMVLSEVVTDLLKSKHKNIALWYVSDPPRLKNIYNLPIHMANDSEFINKKTTANIKTCIGSSAFTRIRALYTYKTQIYSFQKSSPVPLVPIWFFFSQSFFEYFYQVQ